MSPRPGQRRGRDRDRASRGRAAAPIRRVVALRERALEALGVRDEVGHGVDPVGPAGLEAAPRSLVALFGVWELYVDLGGADPTDPAGTA